MKQLCCLTVTHITVCRSLLTVVFNSYTARFNIHKFHVLPHTVYLCVLCRSKNKQRLFPYTALTNWFYNRDRVCLLRGTDWVFIYNSTFCPHSLFMCFLCGSENKQRLFPYTALTDWFCNRDGECLLRGTDWVFIYNSV